MKRLLALFAAMALAGQTPAASADDSSAAPLPVIGTTHSRSLCTLVRTVVAPAVLGLMKTDELIGAGHTVLTGMGHQVDDPQAKFKPEGDRRADMSRVRLGQLIHGMATNLTTVRKFLDTMSATSVGAPDQQLSQDLRAQLQSVAKRQSDALDLLNGLRETELEGQMRTEYDKNLEASSGPTGSKTKVIPPPLQGSGLQLGSLPGAVDARVMATSSTVAGHTVYDQVARSLQAQQTDIARLERTLSPSVIAAARECSATTSGH
jgi:hypothetical protein